MKKNYPTISFQQKFFKRSFFLFFIICATLAVNAQTYQWAKTESITAEGDAMCTDSQGNIYTTGFTYSAGVIGTTTLSNNDNGYLTKYNSSGSVVWSSNFLFSGHNHGMSYGIACDNSGNVFITGTFVGTLVVGSNTYAAYTGPNNAMWSDMFLMKFNTSGSLLWTKIIGGTNVGNEVGYSACTDASGNVIVAGSFSTPTLVIGSSSLTGSSYGTHFIAKFDGSGNPLWATAPISGNSAPYDIEMDNSGNFYICGSYTYKLVSGTTTLTSSGNSDYNYFISKYDASGVFQWMSGGGDVQNDYAFSLDSDPGGNVYMTGGFYTPLLVVGTTTLVNSNYVDAFVIKYNSAGAVQWAKNISSSNGFEVGRVIRTFGSGFFLAGDVAPYGSATLMIGSTAISPTSIYATWLAQFDGSGNPTGYVSYDNASGGAGGLTFNPLSMDIDNNCNLYLAGDIRGTGVFGTHTITAALNQSNPSPFLAKLPITTGGTISLSVSGNLSICSGQSTILSATGATSYSWTNGPATNSFVVNPISTTNYTVTGLASCASNTAVVTVSVNQSPSLTVTTDQAVYCSSSTAQIGVSGANTYSWSNGAQTNSISVVTNSTMILYVIGINSVNACSSTATVILNVTNCSGLESLAKTDIKVYPSPMDMALHVELANEAPCTLSISDLAGRLLLLQKTEQRATVLNVQDLLPGVYFLTVEDGSQTRQIKLIK